MKSKMQEEREDWERQTNQIRQVVREELHELTEAIRQLTFVVATHQGARDGGKG